MGVGGSSRKPPRAPRGHGLRRRRALRRRGREALGRGRRACGSRREREAERGGGRERVPRGVKKSDVWAHLLVVGIEWRYRE